MLIKPHTKKEPPGRRFPDGVRTTGPSAYDQRALAPEAS
jgi:hypothetical protein